MKKRILSLILVCATLLTAIPAVSFAAFAATEDTFTPVTRFVLISDIHVAKHATNPGANVDLMMNRVYAYLDEKDDSVLPSAIISMGDSLNNGWPAEGNHLANRFNSAKAGFKEKYGSDLPIYAIMGNHEYNNGYFYNVNVSGSTSTEAFDYIPKGDLSASDYLAQNNAAFAEAFIDMLWGTESAADNANKGNVGAINNSTTDWHIEIGGMHFIGVSISNHWGNLSDETLAWLDKELAAATADTPNAPVFLFSHHPLRNTVYSTKTGVSNWWSHYMPDNTSYNIATANETHTKFTAIIEKYPNVIFSTGHTHASGNVPLGIWQGETNGVGSGFTAYCPGGLVQTSATVGGDFAIIEIDANNTVRFYPQNVNGAYKNPDGSPLYYEVSYYDNGTHSYGYNETARKAQLPEFAAGTTATFSNMWATDGSVTGTLTFAQAVAGDVYAEKYEVAFVPQDGTPAVYTTVESGAFGRTLNIPATLYATDFILKENKVYDVKIAPINAWGEKGETVTVLEDLATPTSELKEVKSNYSSVYTHPTSGRGVNDIATNGTSVIMAPAWSIGTYNFKKNTAYPYANCSADYGFSTLSSGLSWGIGGFYLASQSNRIIVGYDADGYCTYVTYTAEKSGTLNLTIENLSFYSASAVGANAYAVVKNFSTSLSANNIPFVNWSDGKSGDDLAALNPAWKIVDTKTITNYTITGIEVAQGDTISFVVSRGTGSGDGICDVKMRVDYTKETETVNYVYETGFQQNPSHPSYPTIDKNTVLKDGEKPIYALVQNPNWEFGCYNFGSSWGPFKSGRNPFNAYSSQYGLIEITEQSIWTYGGGYYSDRNRRFTIGSADNFTTYVAYIAEKDGILDVEITDLKFFYANTAYAIVKNFTEVLSGTSGAAFANWTDATGDRWEYAEAKDVTTRVGVEKISVKKGDTVAIVFDRANLGNGDGFYDLNMTVKYRKEYVGDAASYVHKTGGSNFPITGRDAGGFPIFAEGELAYEMGTYKFENSTAYPYGTSKDKYGIIASAPLGGCWSYGGMYSDGKMIVPTVNGYVGYIAYKAEYDGKLDLNISNLTFQREGTAFTVVRNFKDVLVATGGTLTDYSLDATAGYWNHSALNQAFSFTIRDIEVKKGDTVAIVFDTGRAQSEGYNTSTSENQRGPMSMSIDVQYSERYSTVHVSHASEGVQQIKGSVEKTVDWTGSTWTPILYKSRNDAGVASKALVMDTYYPDAQAYVPSSVYQPGNNGATEAYAMISNGQHPQWGAFGSVIVTGSAAAGFRYIAEKSGNVRFSFDTAGAKSGSADANMALVGYAIFVNGVKVWPYGDSNWYNLRQDNRNVDYTAELNAAMPKSLFIAEGDCVEILARNDNSLGSWSNRGNIFLPTVTYETEALMAGSIYEKFAITLLPGAPLADGQIITMNGESMTPIAGSNDSYTVYGIAAREMGDTVTWSYSYAETVFERGDRAVTVPHTAVQEWSGSYLDLMQAYITHYSDDESKIGKAVANCVAAILNYGAAAQTYFDYKTDALVNASLSDAQKAIAATGTYENVLNITKLEGAVFKPYSATLLLEDSLSLKIVVSGAEGLEDEGYQVRFTRNGESTLIDLIPCEGGGGQYKAILPGLAPTRWNEAYEITVLDASGTPVSGTVTYSVTTYALRTASIPEIKAVTDRMLALYEMAVAYQEAIS